MIDLVGKRNWFFLISAIVIIPGIISLAVFGLRPGVDFSSGTAMTLSFDKEVELSQFRQELTDLGYDQAIVQPSGEGDFFVRLPEMSSEQTTALKDGLQTGLDATLTISSLYTVSPIVAAGTVRNTVIAIVLAVVGVSVNNIVVVFDRIRENLKRGVSRDFEVIANYGIIESLGRSLNTGLATLFVILALYLLGGTTTHTLVLALLIGIATGIYSSLCIAGP